MSGDVNGYYATLGIDLGQRRGPNVSVRCFVNPMAHRRGDRDPSCSVDLESGLWNCFGCGAGGGPYDAALAVGRTPAEGMGLLEHFDLITAGNDATAIAPPRASTPHNPLRTQAVLPSEAEVKCWQEGLLADERLLERLRSLRGWTREALQALEIGYDGVWIVFPVSDAMGKLVGVNRYEPDPARRNGRPKMVADRGSERNLFPRPELLVEGARVPGCRTPIGAGTWHLLVEGEPDAVSAWSVGLPAVAVPGVNGWKHQWAERFLGRRVCVVFDRDEAGRSAAPSVARDLAQTAAEVRVLGL